MPYQWLDALKGLAILAVVADHAFIVDDYLVWKHLYFHVSWFILLAGVSNAISASRSGFDSPTQILRLWLRRLRTIVGPYLWASVLAYALLNFRRPSITTFARELLVFHVLPPFYFVALLLQLLLVFPALYILINRSGIAGKLVSVPLIVVLGAVVSQAITFPWALGAHYLFGASFLYLFAIGILLSPVLTSGRLSPMLVLAVSLPAFIFAERLVLLSNGTVQTHPPSNVLLIYALGLAGIGYAGCTWFANSAPVKVLAALGRRSLSIFLYHFLFLIPIFQFRHVPWTHSLSFVHGQLVLMAIAIPVAVAGSVALAELSARLYRALPLRSMSVAVGEVARVVRVTVYPPAGQSRLTWFARSR